MIGSLIYSPLLPPGTHPEIDYTFASPEALAAYSAAHPPAALSNKRVEALQAIPNQELNDFFEGLFKAVSAAVTQFSNGGPCTGDTIANFSFTLRAPMAETVTTEVIGITTGENSFRGAWAAYKAWRRFGAAQAIGDKGGMIEGGLDTLRGIFQSIGGTFYLGYRGLMIAADINKVNAGFSATTLLGKAAFYVGTIGNIFFTLFYAIITGWSIHGAYENGKFGDKFDACKTEDDLIKFLGKKAYADPTSKLNGLTTKETKEKLSGSVMDAMTKLLYAEMEASKPEGEAAASMDEVEKFLIDLFDAKDSELRQGPLYKELHTSMGLTHEQIEDLSFLELLGLKLQELNRQRRKDAKLSRFAGAAAPNVKKAFERGLEHRIVSSDPLVKEAAKKKLEELKVEVSTENSSNNKIYAIFILVGILGLASSGLGFVPILSAAGVMALIVVTLLLCTTMLGSDGYFMLKGWALPVEGWSIGKPGDYDKHYIVFLSVMIVTILALSVGLTLGFGLPLFPLIFAGIFGVVGLGLCGVALDELIYKEKKWKAEHPDLEAFQKTFSSADGSSDARLDEKMTLLFKKLPKSDRHAIRKKYFDMSKGGELPFINKYYQALNITHDFGGAYLNAQTALNAMSNEEEHTLLLRGIKKTLNFYWKKWAIERTETSKLIALEAQALFEAVKKKNSVAIKAAMVKMGDKEHFAQLAQLKADLWYVVKREESKKDLMRIVKMVSDEQKAPAGAQQKNPALCDHAIEILKSA